MADITRIQQLLSNRSKQLGYRINPELFELAEQSAKDNGLENIQALIDNLLLKYLEEKKVI